MSTSLPPPTPLWQCPKAPEPEDTLLWEFPYDQSPTHLMKKNEGLWGRPLARWSLLFSTHTENQKSYEDLNQPSEQSFQKFERTLSSVLNFSCLGCLKYRWSHKECLVLFIYFILFFMDIDNDKWPPTAAADRGQEASCAVICLEWPKAGSL